MVLAGVEGSFRMMELILTFCAGFTCGLVAYHYLLWFDNAAAIRVMAVITTHRRVRPLTIHDLTGFSLGRIYATLDELERAGIIYSEFEDGGSDRAGRPVRWVSLKGIA